MILTADVGEAVDPGALVPGDAAPARRVMLPWTDNTMASFTPDGFRLFGNAMDWAVGRLGPSGDDLRVTKIVYDNSSDPGNIIVTLTFTSELDKQYTLYTSTDFSAPIAERTDLDDSIDGGDGSATFVVDFDLFGLPTSDPRRFFVFRENP